MGEEVVVVEAVEGADDVCIVPEDMHYLTWLEANEYEVNARSIFSRTWRCTRRTGRCLWAGCLQLRLRTVLWAPGRSLGRTWGTGTLLWPCLAASEPSLPARTLLLPTSRSSRTCLASTPASTVPASVLSVSESGPTDRPTYRPTDRK